METKQVNINPSIKLNNVYGSLKDWKVTFFDDKKGVMYQRVTDTSEMRESVDEFANSMYCRPIKKVSDELQKQIIKWVKGGEQKPFVYVLVTESSYDYETGQDVDCFRSLSAAQKEMKLRYKAEVADWKSTFGNSYVENGIDHDIAYIQEQGDFTRNHITWTIYAKEIE